MSYYIYYIIECDRLTYDRMLEAWKQKDWAELCVIGRPDYIWSRVEENDVGTAGKTYLLFFTVNRGPNLWEAIDWVTDYLGVDTPHFSMWSQGEDEDEWHQGGSYVPEGTMPVQTVALKYLEEEDKWEDAPDGYTSYKYCTIAVNLKAWVEITVDYTREEGIIVQSPMEELLRSIDEKLDLIVDLLGCVADSTKDD